jgi:hypothetical protein
MFFFFGSLSKKKVSENIFFFENSRSFIFQLSIEKTQASSQSPLCGDP